MKSLFSSISPFLLAFSCLTAAPLPKHWHETKGFGTDIKGGIAGEVYKVTNLNSSGSGSLKDAASKSNRLVVFEVGGVIEGGFSVASDVTIAGQTAPYPGITTVKGNMTTRGSNIVVSHITHHLGSEVGGFPDAWNVSGSNIVLDHIAVYWGKDETLPIARSTNVTVYKSIIAEGLQFSGHSDGEHSKGLHIQSGNKQLSVIGSLGAHNSMRNPRIDGGSAALANYVLYNVGTGWDHVGPKPMSQDELPDCEQCFNYGIHAHGADVSLVGSIFLWGIDSKAEYFLNGHHGRSANAYLNDNIAKDREGNDLKISDENIKIQTSPAIWPEGMEALPAEEALYEVLRTVGPHPGKRNAHNARIVKDVADGTGEIIDSEKEVGGYPTYTETKRSITVPDGAEARQAWLDSLEDEIAVDRELNLSRLYAMVGTQASDKLRSPSFVHGKASLQTGGFGIKIVQRSSAKKRLHASFNLSTAAPVSLKIIDLAGNTVVRAPPKYCKAGANEITADVGRLSLGLYVCRFQIGNTVINQAYNCY